jgi:short-subunit dehydrogenase
LPIVKRQQVIKHFIHKNKVDIFATMNAIVTGASRGIGKAILEKLVRQGVNVAFCGRKEKDVFNTAKELYDINKVKIYHQTADLSKKAECQAFIKNAIAQLGSIDLLVNNAGTYTPGQIINEEDGALEHLMETNLYSAYHITRGCTSLMMKQKKGHIFNICSIAGMQPYPNGGSYSISKFAMIGFSKNLREELKPHGVKVTTVNPGATMSDSWAGADIDPSRIMESKDIAESIWAIYNLAPQTVVEEIVLRPQLGDL